MKKFLSAILVAGLLLTLLLFSGCTVNLLKPLRICVDFEFAMVDNIEWLTTQKPFVIELEKALKNKMVEDAKAKGISVPKNFKFEYLPKEGLERQAALERIRTEIMSGKGPDVFLCACNAKSNFDAEPLFTIPEKTMQLSFFLTLDEYMEANTVFSEWDEMNTAVLAAGRTDEGQQLLPLAYTIPVSVYRQNELTHTPSKETTWLDIIESEDKALVASAVWTDNLQRDFVHGDSFMFTRFPVTEYILGPLADYSEEELLFTKDELQQRFDEMIELGQRYTAGEFITTPAHYSVFLGHEFDVSLPGYQDDNGKTLSMTNSVKHTDPYTMVPLYSDDGGVTAEITLYAAINRNTRCPEDAFRVLDYFASYDMQRFGGSYLDFYSSFGQMSDNHLPMYDSLMSETQRIYHANPYADASMQGWYLPNDSFEALCEVREQITYVRFRSTLDYEFRKLYQDYLDAAASPAQQDKVITEGYRNLQRIIRE